MYMVLAVKGILNDYELEALLQIIGAEMKDTPPFK